MGFSTDIALAGGTGRFAFVSYGDAPLSIAGNSGFRHAPASNAAVFIGFTQGQSLRHYPATGRQRYGGRLPVSFNNLAGGAGQVRLALALPSPPTTRPRTREAQVRASTPLTAPLDVVRPLTPHHAVCGMRTTPRGSELSPQHEVKPRWYKMG